MLRTRSFKHARHAPTKELPATFLAFNGQMDEFAIGHFNLLGHVEKQPKP